MSDIIAIEIDSNQVNISVSDTSNRINPSIITQEGIRVSATQSQISVSPQISDIGVLVNDLTSKINTSVNNEQQVVVDIIGSQGPKGAKGDTGDSDQVSKTITYNTDDTINSIESLNGFKTMVYNSDGTINNIISTGSYKNKSFVYTDGLLTEVIVS